MEYSKCICDFTLILIVYVFLAFPQKMDQFSHSILGRIFAVLFIVYFTYQDFIYGLLFCILVIYYYQIDPTYYLNKIEGFEYEYQLESGKTDDFYKKIPNTDNYQPYVETPMEYARNREESNFIKENCSDGDLKKKTAVGNIAVNPEMAEHAFPDIKFDGAPCNPCKKHCAFKIIDKRLKAEQEIVLPKNSNDWVDTVLYRVGK